MTKLGDTVTGARVLGARMASLQRQSNPEGRMPLMDHIRELRNRLVKAAAALLVGTAVGLIPAIFDRIWRFVEHPFCAAVINGKHGCRVLGDQLVINGVFDPFMLRVQIAFFFGLIVTCPIWLYQLWAFIAPGLYRREKRWTYAFVGTAAPLFLAGAAIAYFAMSRGLRYLLGLTPHGVVNLAGVLTHERFRKWRRMIIFLVFVFAGVASPSPDPLTMLLLAVPCVVLVEVAEIVIWATDRRRASRPPLYAGLSDDELSPIDLDLPSRDGADAGRSPGPDA